MSETRAGELHPGSFFLLSQLTSVGVWTLADDLGLMSVFIFRLCHL